MGHPASKSASRRNTDRRTIAGSKSVRDPRRVTDPPCMRPSHRLRRISRAQTSCWETPNQRSGRCQPPQPQRRRSRMRRTTFGLDDVIAALSGDLKKARKDALAKSEGDEVFGLPSEAPRLNFSSQFKETPKSGEKAGLASEFRYRHWRAGPPKAGTASETVHRIKLTLNPGPTNDGVSGDLIGGAGKDGSSSTLVGDKVRDLF